MGVSIITPTFTYVKEGINNRPGVDGRFTANTEYSFLERRVRPAVWTSTYQSRVLTHGTPYLSVVFDNKTVVTNKLYAKLVDQLTGPKSELLTASVEWRTSLDMITKRALQLKDSYLAVRQFKFKKAAQLLGISVPKRVRNITRRRAVVQKLSPTSLWLEYWMGWAPMVGDIGNAINVLEKSPIYFEKFSVGVGENSVVTVIKDYDDRGMVSKHRYVNTKKLRLSAYGRVTVTNHNYLLATRLGFINPALTLWQVVPFSFVIDWFANVGQVLSSLTDFAGLTFSRTGTAFYGVSTCEVTATNGRRLPQFSSPYMDTVSESGLLIRKTRTPGALPTAKVNIVPLNKLSLTRAATSVSLLFELFVRK